MAAYKVKIEKIYPHLNESDLFKNKSCILGISLSNPIFWRSSLKEIVDWTSKHFEVTYFVIADSLNRYNELFFNALDENEALSKSLSIGDGLEENLNDLLQDMPSDSFKIVRWKDILNDKPFANEIELFLDFYKKHKTFYSAINGQATDYVNSLQIRNKPIKTDIHFAITCSARYLIEELAIFSKMMQLLNCKVLCYPGAQLPIFIALAEGEYEDIIPTLSKGIYVHLTAIKR